MKDGAELAACDDLAQRPHRRPEAAVMADREQRHWPCGRRRTCRTRRRGAAPAASRRTPACLHWLPRSPGRDAANAASRAASRRWRGRRGRHRSRRSERSCVRRKIVRARTRSVSTARVIFSRALALRGFDQAASPAAKADDRAGDHRRPRGFGVRGLIASMTAELSASGPTSVIAERSSAGLNQGHRQMLFLLPRLFAGSIRSP